MIDFWRELIEKYDYEKWSLRFVLLGILAPSIILILSNLTSFLVDKGAIVQFVFSNEIGPIGDYIAGTAVPFLTLAAFILLYGSYKIQKEELKESSKALAEQAASLQEQLKIMQSQNSQKIFFDLLNLLEKNRAINFDADLFGSKEKDYFKAIQRVFENQGINLENKNCLELLKRKNKVIYEWIVRSMAEDPHRYFNALTGVLKFLENDMDLNSMNLFEIAFHAGISLPEKRFLIMYANSGLPFIDGFIVTRLRRLRVLEWNTENIDYND